MQGRVLSLLSSLGQLMAPLGLAIAGPVADAIGVQYWWLMTGIIITFMGAGAFLVPSIVHIEDRARFGPPSLIS
jgi:MFS transporter, DHA3 family, macrolide efflux protein